MLLRLRAMGLSHALMTALEKVPRQNFVPPMHQLESYEKGALPIECGQTMTTADQVAASLAALEVENAHRVLEIGTGSGYQAALLGMLATKVTTLERFRTLVDKAAMRVKNLEITNVITELADGRNGMPGQVFDRIIVNCSHHEPPRFYLEQLASHGLLIAPIGPGDGEQMLRKYVKIGSRFEPEDLFPVRMQPFIPGLSETI